MYLEKHSVWNSHNFTFQNSCCCRRRRHPPSSTRADLPHGLKKSWRKPCNLLQSTRMANPVFCKALYSGYISPLLQHRPILAPRCFAECQPGQSWHAIIQKGPKKRQFWGHWDPSSQKENRVHVGTSRGGKMRQCGNTGLGSVTGEHRNLWTLSVWIMGHGYWALNRRRR